MPFRTLTGHRRLLERLAGAASRGTLPPSLIFAGPEGVGKRLSAVALAQFLNCSAIDFRLKAEATDNSTTDLVASAFRRKEIPDACGECASCKRIARGVHADVLLIEPGENGSIGVDQVREAVDRAAYRPFEGRRRVVIVDRADTMLAPAQNALLKTLEEPPSASMFVLVTSRPDVLLPTVRSRCPQLRFGRLEPAEVVNELIRTHGYSSSEAHAAASLSDGSIGRALEGASEGYVEARTAAATLLEDVAASPDPRRRLESAKTLTAGRAAGDRNELAARLRALSSMLRDLAVLVTRGDVRQLANADLRPALERLGAAFENGRALAAFSSVDRALAALERNASPKIVADWLALQI
jgi:DNA polymerase-3 subunit delta'